MGLRILSEQERQKKIDDKYSAIIAQLNGVSKKFISSKAPSLEDINLEVYQEDFLSILGSSGCGKTTLLKMMCGLIKPTSGKINWPTSNFQNSVENPANLSFVFQEPNLLPWMNVYDNIKLPLKIYKENSYKADEEIYDIINLVGLKGFEEYYPRQLSGGHTHLFTEKSIKFTANKYNLIIVGEWWFGTDIADLYRSLINTGKILNKKIYLNEINNKLFSVLDDLQSVLDNNKICSEVHLILKKKLI